MRVAGKRTAKGSRGVSFWWGALALGAASLDCAQSPAGSRAQLLLSSGGLDPASIQSLEQGQGEVIREIDDPHTGDRWLLMSNDQLPGGPGRLVLLRGHRKDSAGASGRAAAGRVEAPLPPVIRSGDPLIVEEHTARVDAVLQARALSPAAVGSALNARLTIGGNVVRAVALGPGRAALQPETGVRP